MSIVKARTPALLHYSHVVSKMLRIKTQTILSRVGQCDHELDLCLKKGETRDLPVLTIPTITGPNWLQIRWKVQVTEVIKSTLFGLGNHRVRRSIAFSRSHIFLSLERKCINLNADCVL